MKKILAVLFAALMLVGTVALADTIEGWTDIPLNDISMQFSIPEDFTIAELTDADYESGLAFSAENDHNLLQVYVVEDVGLTTYAAALNDEGFETVPNALVDSGLNFEHIFGANSDETQMVFCFVGADDWLYAYYWATDSEDGAELFGEVLGTIRSL